MSKNILYSGTKIIQTRNKALSLVIWIVLILKKEI